MSFGDFAREILAVALGDNLGEILIGAEKKSSNSKSSVPSTILDVFKAKIDEEKFSRVQFLSRATLVNRETHGGLAHILALFDEFEKKGGVIYVGKKPYRENWTGALLMQFAEPTDNTWMWQVLDAKLAESKSKFFGQLEILNNDNISQYAKQLRLQFERSEIGKSLRSAAKEIAEPLNALTGDNGSLRNLRDRLRAQAMR